MHVLILFGRDVLMVDVLRDPMWQFIAVILAISAILISYILYRKQRHFKALSYEVLSCTPLLTVGKEVKGRIQIRFMDELVQQVHLIVIRIVNSGNVPIAPKDYTRKINLSFGEKARILTSEVIETNPKSLQLEVEKTIEGSKEKTVLEPILINQGDSITLKMLVTKFADQIKIDGRIVGVKEIKEVSVSKIQQWGGTAISLILSFLSGLGVGFFPIGEPFWWLCWGVFGIGLVLLFKSQSHRNHWAKDRSNR